MPEETAPVVSGATETSTPSVETPSSPSTQTSSETTQAPPETATAQEKIDWRVKHREDPDLQAFVAAENQKVIKRAERRWERQNTKATAKDIADKEDVEAALQFARSVADSRDDDDDDTPRVGADHLKRSALLADNFHDSPEYKAVWEGNQAELAKKFAELDTPAFKAWVRAEGLKTLVAAQVNELVRKQVPSVAEAMATERTQQALAGMAVPLMGAGNEGGRWTTKKVADLMAQDDGAEQYAKHRDAILRDLYPDK
jgi:hypothetical protein